MTRQKLACSIGAAALMWFHKHTGDESGFGVILKYEFHDHSITFPILLKRECFPGLVLLFRI